MLLLFYALSLAATKEEERPDKEMLELMEMLRDMDMVKELELMRQMDAVNRGQTPPRQSPQKNQGKTKDRP
jgi:hypothetical protein